MPRTRTTRDQADAARDARAADLFRGLKGASPEAARCLRQHIVLEYLDVADSIARRYSGTRGDDDDVRQVACLGLIKAVKGFDPAKGEDFIAYCVPTVSGEIKRYFRDHVWFVRPPRAVQELRARIGEANARLMQEAGREPTPLDLAADLDEDCAAVTEALCSHESLRPHSLDSLLDDEESVPLGDLLGSADPRLERAEIRIALASACRRLSPRERHIVYLRYFEERTQSQIGRELRVTQMQVSRLLQSIHERLRVELAGLAEDVTA